MQLQNTLTLKLIRKSYVNIWRHLLRGTSTRRLLNIPWFIAVAYLAMILHINPQSSTRTGTLPPLRVAPVAHIVAMVITTTTPEIRWRSERRGPIRKILSEIRPSRGTKRIETLGTPRTPRTPKTRPLPTTTTTMMMVVTASSKARLRRIELFGVVVDLDLVRRAQDAPAEALAAAGFLVVHSIENVYAGLGPITLLISEGGQIVQRVPQPQVEPLVVDEDAVIVNVILAQLQVLHFATSASDTNPEGDQLGVVVMGYLDHQLVRSQHLELGLEQVAAARTDEERAENSQEHIAPLLHTGLKSILLMCC
jgi:hypothetical protein